MRTVTTTPEESVAEQKRLLALLHRKIAAIEAEQADDSEAYAALLKGVASAPGDRPKRGRGEGGP